MLYVVTKDREYQWHVGESLELLPKVTEIIALQADGDELWQIKQMFETKVPGPFAAALIYSIPMSKGQVVSWYGDLARTIFINLGNK